MLQKLVLVLDTNIIHINSTYYIKIDDWSLHNLHCFHYYSNNPVNCLDIGVFVLVGCMRDTFNLPWGVT